MIPSPFAAVVYGAVKVVGYAAFAHGLNRFARKPAAPFAFGAVKTVLGLIGGVTYGLLIVPAIGLADVSDGILFLAAAPVRILAWAVALGLFYRSRVTPRVLLTAMALGVVWSYILDGIIWALSSILPGMETPWC